MKTFIPERIAFVAHIIPQLFIKRKLHRFVAELKHRIDLRVYIVVL